MKFHSQAVRERAYRIYGPKMTPTMPEGFRLAMDEIYEEARAIYERGDPPPVFRPYQPYPGNRPAPKVGA